MRRKHPAEGPAAGPISLHPSAVNRINVAPLNLLFCTMETPSNEYFDAALREADEMVKSSQAYVQSKTERRLDTIGKILFQFNLA